MYHHYSITVNIIGNSINRQVSQNLSLTKSKTATLPINHVGQISVQSKQTERIRAL